MATERRFLSIDFETGSQADLKKVGAAKYAEDPTTRIICVAYTTPWNDANPDNIVCQWNPPGMRWRPPEAITAWIRAGKPVRAWNAMFEYWIWNNLVASSHTSAFPFLKLDQLHDTMAQAAYWGLPLSLDMAGEALPQLGIVKDKQGHALMKRMSRPRGFDDSSGEARWWDDEDPDKRGDLMDYCKQDVAVEKAIGDYLPPLPDRERRIWLMDARANARGIALDMDLARNMKALAQAEQARLNAELDETTGGEVTATTQAAKLAAWAGDRGLKEAKSGGLAKDRLPMLIGKADERGLFDVSNALAIRQEAAKSSVAKLDAMMSYACADGRMRGLTQYYGAFRTGRWAGRGPQVQNFPRSEVEDQEKLVASLLSPLRLEPKLLELFFGVSPLTALSSALRGCLWVPPQEGDFCAVDFSQIEARVLAWLANCQKILDAYREGRDLYKVAASGIYGVPEARVDKDQRQVGKVSVLALGYQGGVGAFQTMAKVYGLEIPDEQADDIKVKWRAAHPEIVNYWYTIDRAAQAAVDQPGTIQIVDTGLARVKFSMWKGHLLCQLPSERCLVYRDAELGVGTYGPVVTYMGVDQYTRKWTRIETYGGKLVENITQAVARDVMADGLLALDRMHGVNVLGSVHDEALLWLDGRPERVKEWIAKEMSRACQSWAKDLPVEADGYVGRRFRK